VNIAELDKESAELLPDRQALGCWNGCGYGFTELNLHLNLGLSLVSVSRGW
jgi:hypothetical protein